MKISVWFAVLVVAILAATWAAAVNNAHADPGPKICFYVNEGFPSGHAFVQLLPDTGPNAGKKDLVWGLYSGTKGPFGALNPLSVKGALVKDNKKPWTWKICYPVAADRLAAIEKAIQDDMKDPPNWTLRDTINTNNCLSWANNIAVRLARVELPVTKGSATGSHDPAVFAKSLKMEGDGALYRGGRVVKNVNKVSPDNSADPPSPEADRCSVSDLQTNTLADPGGVASALTLASNDLQLGSVPVGTGGGLQFSISNVDLQNALVAIDFGDGTVVEETLTASHYYQSPGTFALHAIVLDSGAVNSYRAVVLVDGPASDASLSVTVPDPPPAPLSNLSFVICSDPTNFCEPAVGGTTELLAGGPDAARSAADGSGSPMPYTLIAGVAAAALAVAAGGWYARRRRRVR